MLWIKSDRDSVIRARRVGVKIAVNTVNNFDLHIECWLGLPNLFR